MVSDTSHWGERPCIRVDTYDKANAESILVGVVTELQGNELLITDCGHRYNQLPLTQPLTPSQNHFV